MLQISTNSALGKLLKCKWNWKLCLLLILVISTLIGSSRASILPMRLNLSGGSFPPSIADKIEPIFSAATNRVRLQQQNLFPPVQSPIPTRSPFLDTLFSIPISSLQVMNEFVQTMAVGLQKLGGAFSFPRRFPPFQPQIPPGVPEAANIITSNAEA